MYVILKQFIGIISSGGREKKRENITGNFMGYITDKG